LELRLEKKIKLILCLVAFAILIPIYSFSQTATYSTTLDFNGTSTFVEIPSSNDLKFDSDQFTLEAWIKIENPPPSGSSSGNNTAANRDYIFSKKNDWSFYIINVNGTSYLEGRFRRDYYGNWPQVRSSTPISSNTWYHVAFTNSKGNGRLRLYINGSLDNSANWTSSGRGLTSTTNPIAIGSSIWNGSNNPTNFFDGKIGDVRFWDSERTQSEINSNKNSILNTNCNCLSNLKLYYKLNEGQGTTINDSSVYSITGTVRGSYQWSNADTTTPTVVLSESDNNNLLANSDVVTFTANFSETMTPSPTITIKENDQPVTFYISDYSSNQIGINVQNRRFDQLTRNSNSIVGYTFEVVSSGVTYTLTSLNNQSQSWVYFSTTPEFTPGASGSNGNLDVLLKGKTLINNAYMTPISGTNSYTYSYTTSTVLNSISATVSGQDLSGNSYSGTESVTLSVDNVNPLVYGFSSTDQDYITTSSGTVTYTVRFSEDMESSPQLNIVGISPLNYSQVVPLTYVSTNNSNGDSTWTYGWSPPASITSGTVSISITGNDLAGNPYNAQIENVTALKHKRLHIDNVQPTVSLSSTVSGTAVAQSNSVTITAQFSEPMTESPTISISGQISNATMSLVSTNTLIRKAAQLTLSDYGYNMIAVGSNDWDDILGANVQSGNLLNYYLEIDGVDYQVSEIKLGSKTASDFWWYFATTPEYTPGYSAGETTYFVIKSPNYQTELSNWQYSWTVSSTSSTPTITVSGADLASNSISGTVSLSYSLDNQKPYIISTTISNSLSPGRISATETNTITVVFNEAIDANSFTASDVTITPSGIFTITEDVSVDNITFNGFISANGVYSGIVTLTIAENVLVDLAGNSNLASSTTFEFDNVSPTVTLISSDSDNILSPSSNVTITATFSESMSATPTISLTGLGANISMSAGSDNKIWKYNFNTSSSTSSITATVSGTDLYGNPYSGTESLTLNIDNSVYQISGATINQKNSVVSITFDEEVFTEILSGVATNTLTTSDFSLSISGGSGISLTSANPSSISKIGNSTYNLYISFSGYTIGTETLTISIAENNIYDRVGNSTALSKSISLNSNLLFDYDISNTNSYNGQATSNNNKTVNDLSGNGNHGEITNTDNVYYDTNQNAMFFNGITQRAGGIAISNLNYVSGSSDKIEELTIFARIKVDSRSTTDRANNDERILLSFDRSAVFRFSVGSDQNTSAKGKLAFHFTNSDATFDTHAVNTSDLRDNQWHNVAITFKANESGGLKYYIDGNLVYTHSGTFAPISNGSDNETPRFGYVGTGSEATSFKGSASPPNLFFGHIQSIKYYNKVLESSQLNGLDINAPTVTLSDNISSNYINGSETLRIISTFNEAMSSSPKISISGQVSNLTMTSSTTSVWYYDWNVPDSFNGEVTATVTGTDLAGNSYSGTDSITYVIDNTLPTVLLSDTNSDNIITNSNQVTITATFSEPMTVTPTISISNLITNAVMTATSSTSVWIYPWVVSTTYNGVVSATVSGTDLARNSYSGGESLSFNLDTKAPEIVSLSINNLNNELILNFSEQSTLHDKSSNSFTVTNTSDYFSIGVTSGTATITVNSMTYNADTNNTKYVFGINVNGMPDGFEVITITPKTNKVKDAIGNYALTSQNSNTINLNNTLPVISSLEINEANTQAVVTFSEPVYNNVSGSGALEASDFQLSLSSGSATLSSTVPTSATSSGTLSHVLGLSFQGLASGQEILTISPVSNSIFDSKGGQVNLSSSQSNTITLNDKERPEITGVSIGGSNEFIDIQFSEGVYGNASSNAPILASSLGISQIAGGVIPLRILQITNTSGGQLTGGENIIRATLTQSLDTSNTLAGGILVNNQVSIDVSNTTVINGIAGPTLEQVFQVLIKNASIYDTSANQVSPTQRLNYINPNTINPVIPTSPNIFRLGPTVKVNPPPILTTRVIRFKEKPGNGQIVGEVKAFDIEGESFAFVNQSDLYDGILQIDGQGKISVIEGANLKYDSDYNAAEFKFILRDSENEVEHSVLIIIKRTHPEIKIDYFDVDENAPVGTVVAEVKSRDPLNPTEKIPLEFLSNDGYLEFNGNEITTTRKLDYETQTEHCFKIEAIGSPKEDLSDERYITSLDECFQVIDLPNQKSSKKFFISIFGLPNNSNSSKVDHRRYYNPHNKNVGKWKVKKRIKGGADASKFTIRSTSKGEQKNRQYNEEETEDVLEFIKTPVFNPPGDANQDNIYEVEIEYINTADGEPEVPISVTQTNIQVPEGGKKAIELQAKPALPTDDTDGDGIFDIYDNSPLVANADQTDEDGDGVGDVSDDFDHDGVWNPFDTCPDTPLGEVVNLSGCLIYYVPSNNFTLSKIEKCAGENSIRLDVLDTTVTYNISVSGTVNKTESFAGSTWTLDKLSGGTYSICVNIDGVSYSEFERCFELTISDPKPLVVSGILDKSNQSVTYDLSGGDVYNISHNGKTTQTQSSKYTVSLSKGLNKIKISTGIECQGLYEDNYLNSFEVKYAPNPIDNYLDLYFGGNDDFIEIGIYTVNGQLIDIKKINLPFYTRNYRLETSNYKQGVYIIKISGATIDQSIQVIKK